MRTSYIAGNAGRALVTVASARLLTARLIGQSPLIFSHLHLLFSPDAHGALSSKVISPSRSRAKLAKSVSIRIRIPEKVVILGVRRAKSLTPLPAKL